MFPRFDREGFDLEEIETAIFGEKLVDFKYRSIQDYDQVDARDAYGTFYSGLIIPDEKEHICKTAPSSVLVKGRHANTCNRAATCTEKRVHFFGFIATSDELVPECNIFPYSGCEKNMDGQSKCQVFESHKEDADETLQNVQRIYAVFDTVYKQCLNNQPLTVGIDVLVQFPIVEIPTFEPEHPSALPVYYANMRRAMGILVAQLNEKSNYRTLQWIKVFLEHKSKNGTTSRHGGVLASNTPGATCLLKSCKYTIVANNDLILYHLMLVAEIFVRFGGLDWVFRRLTDLCVNMTDNPHDFDMWYLLLDIALAVVQHLKAGRYDKWHGAISGCVDQWIKTCAKFMNNNDSVRLFHIRDIVMKAPMPYDTSLSEFEKQFLARHVVPFLRFDSYILKEMRSYTLKELPSYHDMASRWIVSSTPERVEYVTSVRMMLTEYIDLLPELLPIVYEYCDV